MTKSPAPTRPPKKQIMNSASQPAPIAAIDSLDETKQATTDSAVEPLLLRRWSPRAFSDQTVSESNLRTLFTAATWAASSYNEQPWRFVVGRSGDETYQRILRCLTAANQGWARSAPVLFASFARRTFSHNDQPNPVAPHDVGAACANLAIQATALGLYVHGMAGYDAPALRTALEVPVEFDPAACWALGYRGDPAMLPEHFAKMERSPRQRKGVNEVVFARWGSPAW